MIRIRDFIYIDVEKLYSLYSQVFEGVADQILNSYINSLEQGEGSTSNTLLKTGNRDTRIVEVSRRTENRFLYDHMYNVLEERILTAIFDTKGITQENYLSALNSTFLIRVQGTAELEDFARARDFLARFNNMGEAMHYITSFADRSASIAAPVRSGSGGSKGKAGRKELNETKKVLHF